MIWFNGSDLISPKANNGLLQPRLQHDNDDDDMDYGTLILGEGEVVGGQSMAPFESATVVSYRLSIVTVAHLRYL